MLRIRLTTIRRDSPAMAPRRRPADVRALFSRHPRYSFALALICGVAFFILCFPDSAAHLHQYKDFTLRDPSLKNRVKRAEQKYQKVLQDRHVFIEKMGPKPQDLMLFPPDREPWPPYTAWDFFPAAFNCPHEMERIGAFGDGGKWVCGLSRLENMPDCVIYSVGINYESSFEAEILARTRHCEVWGYDYSVNSFGPEITKSQLLRAHFHPFFLAGTDAHGENDEPKRYTLESLMRMNGHNHIDILKVDIESWEFETLSTLIRPYVLSGRPLPFAQLQLEIHLYEKTFPDLLKWWEMLEEAGLRPFMTEPNLVYANYNRFKKGTPDLAEYSFLNIKGNNIFIGNPVPPRGSSSGGE